MGSTAAHDEADQSGAALSLYDATSLVVGAVVGADIYVAAALGAGMLGPAMLVAWVLAGVIAALISLSFAQCAAIIPRTGGAYAYTREAFGHFPGFLAGWALYVAELVGIAIFPVAFARYLTFFLPGLSGWQMTLAKAGFVAFLVLTNYIGTRAAGRVNDALTLGKLAPLVLLILVGVAAAIARPEAVAANLDPFAPLGWRGLGGGIILAFWAYAGFELAVLPAAEVVDAPRTLPKAMVLGMGIATAFYLLVNAIVIATVDWPVLARSVAPLATALQVILASLGAARAWLGGAIMSLGAILSISGADESAMLGTSRLSYAMAADGYLPRSFARLHPRYRTPYWGIVIQGVFALVASIFGGLRGLIRLSVLLLSLAYLATVLSAIRLTRRVPERRLRIAGSRLTLLGALGGVLYLMSQTDWVGLGAAAGLLVLGVVVYIYFAPRSELVEANRRILSSEHRLAAIRHALQVGPANALRAVRRLWGGEGGSVP